MANTTRKRKTEGVELVVSLPCAMVGEQHGTTSPLWLAVGSRHDRG